MNYGAKSSRLTCRGRNRSHVVAPFVFLKGCDRIWFVDQIVTRVVAGSQLQQCALILVRAVLLYIKIRYIVMIYRYMHTKKMPRQ
jgi:hypothetical protein